MMTQSPVDVIIPTWNNPDYLYPCVKTLIENAATADLFRVIVVNNGHPESVEFLKEHPTVRVIQMTKNAGWEGGLLAGLKESTAPFVCFLNDDTFFPPSSKEWANILLSHFADPRVAAVGPASNVVMGEQNIFVNSPMVSFTKYLIGFCLMVRRADLDAAGGVDDTMPGGDDLDLSIRLRDLGKLLLYDKRAFVWHHGFKTGERVNGTAAEGGWNSIQMTERTNLALIRKHGLRKFTDLYTPMEGGFRGAGELREKETEVVKKYIVGDRILELGCGPRKTIPNAIGIDVIPNGAPIPGLFNEVSQADIVADVEKPLPVEEEFDTVIARHILEHCVNAVDVVRNWGKALKHGGRLIIAVPDQGRQNTIPMNYQHVHAFSQESLRQLMEIMGWKTIAIEDCDNLVSFAGVFEKNGLK